MHIPSITSSLLTLAAATLVGLNPVSAMAIDANTNTGSALSAHLFARAECGYPSGNCYDNGCDGEKGAGSDTCTAGEYAGCPCGYGCGSDTGSCYANNCDGVPDANGRPRCTNAYYGCDCTL